MVKKIKKLRESEEDIEMKESEEEVKNSVEEENDDEMEAIREACKRIHEQAEEIKEEEDSEEMKGVFAEIKEELEDIKESLDIINDKKLDEEEDEEFVVDDVVDYIKESLDKFVDDNKELSEEDDCEVKLSEEDCESIKESLDKLVNKEDELELKEAEEIRDELKDLCEELEVAAKEHLNEGNCNLKEKDCEEGNCNLKEKESLEESVDRIFVKANLTEEAKKSIVTLIEAKIKESEEEKIKEIEQKAEEYGDYLKQEAEAEVEKIKEELENKADAYLNDVVSEWTEENKLAIENGIRSEIAESVLTGIKKVLKENNINIPEGKSNLLEQTLDINKRLQTKLGEKLAVIAKLQEEKKALVKYKMIEENSQDLSFAQKSKLTKLLENVNYKNENELVRKINVLKENYLSTARPATESVSKKIDRRPTNDIYESYASFIEKSVK